LPTVAAPADGASSSPEAAAAGNRPDAEPSAPFGAHERREQVTNLLGVLVQLVMVGAGRGGGEILDDPVHLLLGEVGQQLHEGPAVGTVRRDLGLGHPPLIHMAEQVVLRADVGVHAGRRGRR
jgi:hypothetical protein